MQCRKVDIVEHVLQKMEKYAANLEIIVEQRTIELLEEKRKTEMLLHRMLPPYAAFIIFVHLLFICSFILYWNYILICSFFYFFFKTNNELTLYIMTGNWISIKLVYGQQKTTFNFIFANIHSVHYFKYDIVRNVLHFKLLA